MNIISINCDILYIYDSNKYNYSFVIYGMCIYCDYWFTAGWIYWAYMPLNNDGLGHQRMEHRMVETTLFISFWCSCAWWFQIFDWEYHQMAEMFRHSNQFLWFNQFNRLTQPELRNCCFSLVFSKLHSFSPVDGLVRLVDSGDDLMTSHDPSDFLQENWLDPQAEKRLTFSGWNVSFHMVFQR